MSDQIVDLKFKVSGDCVHAGYAYPLYSSIKKFDTLLATNPLLQISPLSGITPLERGLLALDYNKSTLTLRLPLFLVALALTLDGQSLLVGRHMIDLHDPTMSPLRSGSSIVHCEAWSNASFKVGRAGNRDYPREQIGYLAHQLKEICGFEGVIILGRQRVLKIGGHPAQITVPFELRDVIKEHAVALKSHGVGGRCHMGCGFITDRQLPQYLRRPQWEESPSSPTWTEENGEPGRRRACSTQRLKGSGAASPRL